MTASAGAQVHIDGRSLWAQPGMSLFDCARALGLQVPAGCQESGRCRECLIEVEHGAGLLTPPGPDEGRLRLMCRSRIVSAEGELRCRTPRSAPLRIPGGNHGLRTLPALDPAVTREQGTILIDGVPVARSPHAVHGLALDLGTTSVALRLYDLESDALRASRSFENPQRAFGADVLARIQHDGAHPGRHLQRVLRAALVRAIGTLPCAPDAILELVVAGNPTLRDLFFGLDVARLGQAPFQSLSEHALRAGRRCSSALSAPARQLGLPLHPAARVYGLPLVASHVGADTAAGLLATGLLEGDAPALLLDIGTNSELVIGHRGRAVAASCPAGPAFEGGGIGCGMPAHEGAIERVRLHDDGRTELGVIGGGVPLGICGSGLVDLLSELRRSGRMDSSGRLAGGGAGFVIDPQHGLSISEPELAALAQAKGAIAASLRCVLASFGASPGALTRFWLAGSFGQQLDVAAALQIGLLPELPHTRIVAVGNASLEGAALALRSLSLRRALESQVQRIEHVALESDPAFFDHFVEGCQFSPQEAFA